ncbi:MAG: hypothetical protein KF768_09290 [Phycisphaeraceae bacterium]|nr:hypothetical protein [Phycisphaeraceae bacterium]
MLPRRLPMLVHAAAAALALPLAAAQADDIYDCTVTPTASNLSYNFNGTAPTTGSFRGDEAATPASRTRTPPASIFSCGTIAADRNDAVPFTGTGTIAGSGSNIEPSGTFRLALNTATNQSRLLAASFDLLGAMTATAPAQISNFSTPAFCAVNPSCLVPIPLTINLPLGDAVIEEVLAELSGGPYTGTLTATGPGQYDFSINAMFAVTPSVEFLGSPFNTGTQIVPVVFSGSATVTGTSIAVTNSLNVQFNQTENTPIPLPESPFTVTGIGICEGLNLLLAATITSSSASFSTMSTVVSAGTLKACPGDFNDDGVVDLADLLAFLGPWNANLGQSVAAGTNGDFNGDGVVDLADLLAFLGPWNSNLGQACQ